MRKVSVLVLPVAHRAPLAQPASITRTRCPIGASKNLPHQLAAVDEASLRELAGLIRTYFHHTEGRGNNCVVECFRRGELDYFFAYPEDYSQPGAP
jgi:hypothetical protein